MNIHSYSTSIEVSFPPGVVFERINAVSKWWPEEFAGESKKLNDEFTFGAGGMHYSKQKIVELMPDKKVVWLTTESLRKPDNYDWTGAKMIFELTPKGDITGVKLTYDGPAPEDELDRLAQACDTVMKVNLYNFITAKTL